MADAPETTPPQSPTDGLRNRIGGLLTAGLDARAQLLVSRSFSHLWHGEALRPTDVAGDVDPADADEVFRRLSAAGRCELDAGGRIVGIYGITEIPTAHRIVAADGTRATWCGFDTVGIPTALGIDATATTSCPHCGAPITVAIEAGAVVDGGTLVVWLPADPGENLIADFCSRSNLFCSVDHLEAWRAGRSGDGDVVAVADAAEMGRETWADVADVARQGPPTR